MRYAVRSGRYSASTQAGTLGPAFLALLIFLLAGLFTVSCLRPLHLAWKGRELKFGYYDGLLFLDPNSWGWPPGSFTFRRSPPMPGSAKLPTSGVIFLEGYRREPIGSYRVEWKW